MDLIDICYERAIDALRKCSTPHGLFASAGIKGYNAVWARDSMISMIGASLLKEKSFKETFKQSIITLEENQSKNGQIPNCVDKWSERKPHVDFKTIDSSLWFIIGNYIYKNRYDNSLFNRYKESIKKTLNWLRCQDSGEVGMLTQLPTSDWQDAFPHKYGYTISTQALYYKILDFIGDKRGMINLKFMVNENSDDKLWGEMFYFAYRWKNHGKYREIGNWFDSLGNLLAVVFDLADKSKTEKIISYIDKKKINLPYPVKAIYPPMKKGDKNWHDYFEDCDARKPYHYLNGGIWTFIGGFYVLALIKIKKFSEAEKQLEKLAKANLKGNFSEWLNGKTGKPSKGQNQAWNAGMYILAYKSLKDRKVLI